MMMIYFNYQSLMMIIYLFFWNNFSRPSNFLQEGISTRKKNF